MMTLLWIFLGAIYVFGWLRVGRIMVTRKTAELIVYKVSDGGSCRKGNGYKYCTEYHFNCWVGAKPVYARGPAPRTNSLIAKSALQALGWPGLVLWLLLFRFLNGAPLSEPEKKARLAAQEKEIEKLKAELVEAEKELNAS